ncbi:hypothetical protein M3Y99_00446400 [Aphelenchoides fujianensis]|nr:hypothetical protein M3Y99_00446400 [Aphelenchoides fujianensis]
MYVSFFFPYSLTIALVDTFLQIGTPPQHIPVQFDYATVPLVVSSEQCGQRLDHCYDYCGDQTLARLYCHDLCYPITRQMWNALCTTPFVASNSSTYTRVENRTWTESLQCCRNQFFGWFAQDRVRFEKADPKFRDDSFELEFVEGTYMQSSAFYGEWGLLGLGLRDQSGSVNFVEQLFRAGRVDAPILSFNRGGYALVGALNTADCGNWSFLPVATGEQGWTVEVERIVLYGVEFTKQRVSFDGRNPDLVIPHAVRRGLVEAGVVLDDCHFYRGDLCVRTDVFRRPVELHVGDQTYAFSVQTEQSDEKCRTDARNRTFCDVWTEPPVQSGRSFATEPWVLNNGAIMDTLCWAFDYEHQTVGVGQYRLR